MQDYISDWFIPMDFGNDMPEEEPSGHKTEAVIGGKSVIVDKTGNSTVVLPS